MQEMTATQRYEFVKSHMICPDCGNDLKSELMTKIEPHNKAHQPNHTGLTCTYRQLDKQGNHIPSSCKYYIFAGETK